MLFPAEIIVNLVQFINNPVDKTVKILVLNNEIEARLLDALLDEKGIPHLIRSYHDSALDGLWQVKSGWGHLQAPEEYKEEILEIYNGMSPENESLK